MNRVVDTLTLIIAFDGKTLRLGQHVVAGSAFPERNGITSSRSAVHDPVELARLHRVNRTESVTGVGRSADVGKLSWSSRINC